MVSLQEFLIRKFTEWSPPAPQVLNKTKYSITLHWGQVEPFEFIADQLLYRLEKNDKIPPWHVVYRGGKTTKEIDNLAPRHPHKFRLRVILKSEAVARLAETALSCYGDEQAVHRALTASPDGDRQTCEAHEKKDCTEAQQSIQINTQVNIDQEGGAGEQGMEASNASKSHQRKWLESRWSEATWSNTDTDGSSATCFCMAVRCGYIKQVQVMLEERPELISILNPTNGFTPLTTAVRKGDINTVRYLLAAGAPIDQPSATGQTALHVAVLLGFLPIVDLLIEKGADFQARDGNALRVEHYAVDSGRVGVLRRVLAGGGDLTVRDSNGWSPLGRALWQRAGPALLQELLPGSALDVRDRAGLALPALPPRDAST